MASSAIATPCMGRTHYGVGSEGVPKPVAAYQQAHTQARARELSKGEYTPFYTCVPPSGQA